MINLLPGAVKEDIKYARRNAVLLRWAAVLLVTLAIIGLVTVGGGVYIQQSKKSYEIQNQQARETLKIQKLDETQSRLLGISNNIKLVIQVLSRDILFSKLLTQLGSVTPQGVILSKLEISQVQGGLDLAAKSTSIETATQLQVNLQDPSNKIFDKADIVSIQCGATSSSAKYPCDITIRVLFTKNNPYAYLSNEVKKK